jgi:hypothetical protein
MVVYACNPTIQRWRQEDCEFHARLGYTMRYCPKEKEREGKRKPKRKRNTFQIRNTLS